MNNINDLFDELFGKEENKQTALLYLSSLMVHTESPEDIQVKTEQAKLLQTYMNACSHSNKVYYLEIITKILQMLQGESK